MDNYKEEALTDIKDLQKPMVSVLLIIIGLIASGFLIYLFHYLAVNFSGAGIVLFDRHVGQWFVEARSPWLTPVFYTLTTVGSGYMEVPIALFAAFYLVKKKNHILEAVVLGTSLAGGYLLNEILKAFYHRVRPDFVWLVQANGYSFPSGHAMISVGFYGFLGYLVWLNLAPEQRLLRRLVPVVAALLILGIGISRLYMGVHYISDVTAGFLAGGVWLMACMLGLLVIRYYKAG